MNRAPTWRLRLAAAGTLAFVVAVWGLAALVPYAAYRLLTSGAGPVVKVAAAVLLSAAAVVTARRTGTPKRFLRRANARPARASEYPEARAALERLARTVDVPTPALWLAETSSPNAFSVGFTRRTSVVCVTTGLLRTLDPAERDAVLAHELAHVANRDAALLTGATVPRRYVRTVQGICLAFACTIALVDLLPRALFADAGVDVSVLPPPVLLIGVGAFGVAVLSTPAVKVGDAAVRTLSYHREFAADEAAARITGEPSALAAALRTLHDDAGEPPSRDLRRAMDGDGEFFLLPLRPDADHHPPTRERIARLAAIEQRQEGR